MFDIYFIVGIFIFAICSFFEIIIFNEEALLTLCFVAFIFFCFNTLSVSVLEAFNARGAKFEADLFVSFQLTKTNISAKFSNFLKLRGILVKFKLLSTSIIFYLNQYKKFATTKIGAIIVNIGLDKLSELVLIQNKFVTDFQKKTILNTLYPLIFETTNYNILSLFTSISGAKNKFSKKTDQLKFLSTN
jgi:hypothetical protein